MESRKKLKWDKDDDQPSTPRTPKPTTSASNTRVVNESSSRDQDNRNILRDGSTQKDNHPPNDSVPLGTLIELAIDGKFGLGYLISGKPGQVPYRGVLYHPADKQRALSSPAEGLSKAKVPTTSNQIKVRRQAKAANTSNQAEGPSKAKAASKNNLAEGLSKAKAATKRNQAEGLSKAKAATTSNQAEGLHKEKVATMRNQAEGLSQAKVTTTSNQASLNQLQPRIDLNQLPLHPVLPGLDPLNQQGLSSGIAELLSARSWGKRVQQNPLPQYRNNQRQPAQPRNIQSSFSELWDRAEKMERKSMTIQSTADDAKAQGQSLASDVRAMKQILHPFLTGQATETTSANVLLPTTLQGGENTSQAQRIHAKSNSNPMHSQPSPNPSIPVTEGGPGSTSENKTANDESNRPVSIAAAEVLPATDAEGSGETTDLGGRLRGKYSNFLRRQHSKENP